MRHSVRCKKTSGFVSWPAIRLSTFSSDLTANRSGEEIAQVHCKLHRKVVEDRTLVNSDEIKHHSRITTIVAFVIAESLTVGLTVASESYK